VYSTVTEGLISFLGGTAGGSHLSQQKKIEKKKNTPKKGHSLTVASAKARKTHCGSHGENGGGMVAFRQKNKRENQRYGGGRGKTVFLWS